MYKQPLRNHFCLLRPYCLFIFHCVLIHIDKDGKSKAMGKPMVLYGSPLLNSQPMAVY